MKKFNLLGRLSVLVVMFAMSSLSAMAVSSKDFFSKVTVKSTGNGKVYLSYKEKADAPEYADESTAESGADNKQAISMNHNYYLSTQPEEGYFFKGLFSNEECTEKITVEDNSFTVAAQTNVDDATYTYFAKFVPGVEANLTIKAGKYATFVAPYDVTLPDGVTAYIVTVEENKAKLTALDLQDRILPAGSPVIVKSEVDVNESYLGLPTEEVSVTNNGLVGFYQSGTEVPVGAYVLQTQNGVQCFYKVGGTVVNAVQNRCYLPAPATNNARLGIVLGDDEDATAVNGVSTEATPAEYYSANGVKAAAPQKGVNIVKMKDGSVKKMILK